MASRSLTPVEVVAGLICENGRVLACQRSADAAFPLKWEFPGGKVEEGENHKDALRRELHEELGIAVESAKEICQYQHTYKGISKVHLTFFWVQKYKREVKNLVFRQIVWVELNELSKFDFLDGDLTLIEKLVRQGGVEFL